MTSIERRRLVEALFYSIPIEHWVQDANHHTFKPTYLISGGHRPKPEREGYTNLADLTQGGGTHTISLHEASDRWFEDDEAMGRF